MFFSMAKIVLKNLFQKPATRRYPFEKRKPFTRTRGHVVIDIAACIFCGLCQKKCPTDAIVVAREEKKWEIQRMQCIACANCIDACPKKCLRMEQAYTTPSRTKKQELFTPNA